MTDIGESRMAELITISTLVLSYSQQGKTQVQYMSSKHTCGRVRVGEGSHQLVLVEAGEHVLDFWVVLVPEEKCCARRQVHGC